MFDKKVGKLLYLITFLQRLTFDFFLASVFYVVLDCFRSCYRSGRDLYCTSRVVDPKCFPGVVSDVDTVYFSGTRGCGDSVFYNFDRFSPNGVSATSVSTFIVTRRVQVEFRRFGVDGRVYRCLRSFDLSMTSDSGSGWSVLPSWKPLEIL